MDAPAVLFDLDRTLIDVQSFTDYAAALTEVEQVVDSWPDIATPQTDWNTPTHRCMAVLVALAGDPRWQVVSDIIERHERTAVDACQAMPHLDDALRRTEDLPRAVVTLLPPGAARAALDRHRVAIATLVARHAGARPKPAPDQLIAAMATLETTPGVTVMIGDSSWDAAAADAAGCGFIGVTNGAAGVFAPDVTQTSDLAAAVDLLGA